MFTIKSNDGRVLWTGYFAQMARDAVRKIRAELGYMELRLYDKNGKLQVTYP